MDVLALKQINERGTRNPWP